MINHISLHIIKEPLRAHPILVVEPAFGYDNYHKNKFLEILFEDFMVPAVSFVNGALLSLYYYGKKSGIVVSSGEDVTCVVPIWNGKIQKEKIKRCYISGRHISFYLEDMFIQNKQIYYNIFFEGNLELIKENTCRVALNYETELEQLKNNPILLDSRFRTYSFVTEVIDPPEIIFEPNKFPSTLDKPRIYSATTKNQATKTQTKIESFLSLFKAKDKKDKNDKSKSENDKKKDFTNNDLNIVSATYECIMSCDIEMRQEMFNNIVLSGGNMMFKGIEARFSLELKKLHPNCVVLENIDVDKLTLPCAGGIIYSLLSKFRETCILRETYSKKKNFLINLLCLQ